MRFCDKNEASAKAFKGLSYEKKADKKQMTKILLKDQRGFCAYSEEYIASGDPKTGKTRTAADLEHYLDQATHPKLKNDYHNLYLVTTQSHRMKNRGSKTLPPTSLMPHEAKGRLEILDFILVASDDEDHDAAQLVKYLRLDSPQYAERVENHVKEMRELLHVIFQGNKQAFLNALKKYRHRMSYASFLEKHLEIDLEELL